MALLVGGDFAKKQIFKEKTILESTKKNISSSFRKWLKNLLSLFEMGTKYFIWKVVVLKTRQDIDQFAN